MKAKPILDAAKASDLGEELLACGSLLVRRREVLDDPGALREIARMLATGLQTIEGALGEVVLAPPRAADGCGEPFLAATAATDIAEIDMECS